MILDSYIGHTSKQMLNGSMLQIAVILLVEILGEFEEGLLGLLSSLGCLSSLSSLGYLGCLSLLGSLPRLNGLWI